MMVNRIDPQLPAEHRKTYGITRPTSTHQRSARCEEVDCPRHRDGWQTVVDEGTDLGARQAGYVRRTAGRAFKEAREAGLTVFRFEAGQQCFADHQVAVERPPLFIVRGGDWRGNPRQEVRQHASPENWVEDFAEHQERLARAQG